MSKYEKNGTITFSPTAITDKEEVHKLHKKVENPGGVQPDWNQNDETAPDYVKNRPFYTSRGFHIIQEETSIVLDQHGYGDYDGVWYPEKNITYTVIWDGVPYEGIGDYDADMCGYLEVSINGETLQFYEGRAIYGTASMAGQHTFSIGCVGIKKYKIDEEYIPDNIVRSRELESKMDTRNPTGTGTFNFGRYANTEIGDHSIVIAGGGVANEGYTTVTGMYNAYDDGKYFAQKLLNTKTHGFDPLVYYAEDYMIDDNRLISLIDPKRYDNGNSNSTVGKYTLYATDPSAKEPELYLVYANGASAQRSHVYNVVTKVSRRYKYAHIVGNGTSHEKRSNAHTLDWEGNAWYGGTVEGTAMILSSSTTGSTKRFKITVDDSGLLTATELTE